MTTPATAHTPTGGDPIAVLGATGAQGGPVARALLAAGRPVRAIARSPEKLAELAADVRLHSADEATRLETAPVDLVDTDGLRRALEGVSGAFAHLPFVPIAEVVEAQSRSLARALVAAEVPLTVFTLSGPTPTSGPTGVASFDTKAIAEQVMRTSGAPVITLTPLTYLANLSAPFTAPWVLDAGELRYPLPAAHRQRWVSVEDQAALAVAALRRPDLAGRTFAIGEPRSGPELAAGISAGLGRPIHYVPITPRQFADTAIAPLMGPELAEALAHDYALIGRGAPGIELAGDADAIVRELGVPYTGIAEWARSQDWEGAARIYRAAVS